MRGQGTGLRILPCLNSSEVASARRRELDIPREVSAALDRSAAEASIIGFYVNKLGEKVDWIHLVDATSSAKRSIFITCAAPVASRIGQPESGDLLQRRIYRVLAIAKAFDYSSLVLGAWGCGAFGNDIHRTAVDFRQALENEFRGAFSDVLFAVTDWSPERRFLGPFRDVFASA